MVFGPTGIFDEMARPGAIRGEIRRRIFPPPDCIAFRIPPHHQIKITIAIDVMFCATGFDLHDGRFNHIALPAVGIAPKPNERRAWGGAATNHKIVEAILVNIENQASRLFFATTRFR